MSPVQSLAFWSQSVTIGDNSGDNTCGRDWLEHSPGHSPVKPVLLTARVGIAIVVGTALGNLSGNIMPLLLPGYESRFALTSTALGVIAAAQLVTLAVMALCLSGRIGGLSRTKVATVGLGVTAAGYLATGLASSAGWLGAASVVTGLGLGAVFAASSAAMAATTNHDRTASIAVVGSTIVIAAIMVAVPLVQDLGGPLAAYAILATICLLAIPFMRALPGAATSSGGMAPATRLSAWFIGGVVLLAITDQGAWSYAGLLAKDHRVLNDIQATFLLSIAALTALAGVPAATFLARRFGRRAAVIAVLLTEAAAKSVLPIAGVALFVGSALVWQMAYLGVLVLMLAVAADRDPSGRWVAAAGGALAIGAGLGPAAVGWLLDVVGTPGLSVALAAVTALAAVPLTIVAAGTPPRRGIDNATEEMR